MVSTEAGRRLSERMNGMREWMSEAIEAIEREALAAAHWTMDGLEGGGWQRTEQGSSWSRRPRV